MEYHHEDRWLLGIKDGITWREWVVAIVVGVLLGLMSGCDGQDAANTAVDEQEAHQRHVDILLAAGWVKFQPTVTPMRASDLDLTVTACQQIQDRQWECFAK